MYRTENANARPLGTKLVLSKTLLDAQGLHLYLSGVTRSVAVQSYVPHKYHFPRSLTIRRPRRSVADVGLVACEQAAISRVPRRALVPPGRPT